MNTGTIHEALGGLAGREAYLPAGGWHARWRGRGILPAAAGVAAYWAFLAGRRVIYFGRKGEFHSEEFPPAKT